MNIQSLSKRDASKYRPERPTLLISIQDGDKAELPFKQRTNHITRRLYVDTLFLYFDDIDPTQFTGNPSFPFVFDDHDAFKIIKFLEHHYKKNDFKDIIIHCQAGVSRSHAIALFAAKYFTKDEDLYQKLLHQKGKVFGGNQYIYNKLKNIFEKTIDIQK